jgi:hypothetical protein
MKKRIYNDCINEDKIEFLSNAPQKLINSLEFNGEWCIVKSILINWGWLVMDIPNNN